jgi:hypothetical protein
MIETKKVNTRENQTDNDNRRKKDTYRSTRSNQSIDCIHWKKQKQKQHDQQPAVRDDTRGYPVPCRSAQDSNAKEKD